MKKVLFYVLTAIKKVLLYVLAAVLVGLCALSSVACMPPWWTAEAELPEKIKNLYRGKTKTHAPNRFKQFVMSGYQSKAA